MKILIDENISSYIVNKLKQHGHEIYKAKRGTDDFSILQYAIENVLTVLINLQFVTLAKISKYEYIYCTTNFKYERSKRKAL